MLDEKLILEVRRRLESSGRPLFFFHDDPDGSTSFMQLHRFRKEGKGVIVKTGPRLTADSLRRVEEFGPDAVFVLDIALIDEEFLGKAGVPVVWLDHHGLENPQGSLYVNPRSWGVNVPPCYMSYEIAKRADPWLAMVGCVGDWFMPPPDLLTMFKMKFPGIIDGSYSLPEELLFKTKIGSLVQILSFNLKGKSNDAMTAVKIFSRLEGPQELLEESTPQARWLTRRYRKVKTCYDELKKDAIGSMKGQDGLLGVFVSGKDRFAISKDLAGELSFLFPKKVIVLAREKDDVLRVSIRSSRSGPAIDKALAEALRGIEGSGGGHEHACGANIKKEDFEQFVGNLKRELGVA